MNSAFLYNTIRFVSLLVFQILLFNNINLFGYVNPYPYILFIILYPLNGSKSGLLISSFLLGLTLDIFLNSGGVHATSCIVLSYLRPLIFKFSFGLSYEYQTVRLIDNLTPERFSFIFIAVLLHHITLFILEVFSFDYFWEILLRTLLSTLFSIFIIILIIYLIKPRKR